MVVKIKRITDDRELVLPDHFYLPGHTGNIVQCDAKKSDFWIVELGQRTVIVSVDDSSGEECAKRAKLMQELEVSLPREVLASASLVS